MMNVDVVHSIHDLRKDMRHRTEKRIALQEAIVRDMIEYHEKREGGIYLRRSGSHPLLIYEKTKVHPPACG